MTLIIVTVFVTFALAALAAFFVKRSKSIPSSALGLVSLTAVPLFLVWQWQLPDLAWVAWLSLAQIAWLAGRSTLATFRELRTRKVDGVTTF